jgi:hypothetical protein
VNNPYQSEGGDIPVLIQVPVEPLRLRDHVWFCVGYVFTVGWPVILGSTVCTPQAREIPPVFVIVGCIVAYVLLFRTPRYFRVAKYGLLFTGLCSALPILPVFLGGTLVPMFAGMNNKGKAILSLDIMGALAVSSLYALCILGLVLIAGFAGDGMIRQKARTRADRPTSP